jgi:hypothetical protein
MKKTALFTAPIALLFIAGCSTTTTLTTPKQLPGKHALQVIHIEVPLPDTYETLSSYAMVSDDIDSMLKNPQAVITEYPIAYAAVGETAINDQTETLIFPDIDEPAKVGQYVELTLKEIDNGYALCDLWFFDQAFKGIHKIDATSTPVFTKQEMKTQIGLVLGTWFSMGGSTSETTENFCSGEKTPKKATRTKEALFIRILPPAGTTP